MALTRQQQSMVYQVRFARVMEIQAQVELNRQADELKRLVADAMDLGIPATLLADALGVTRARVYQIKDEIRAVEDFRSA